MSLRTLGACRVAGGCAGILVGSIAVADARAVGFAFETLYHSDSAMPGAPGSSLLSVDQVVALENGDVASILRFDNGGSGVAAVTLNAAGDASVNLLAQEGQAVYGAPSGPVFGAFWNLAGANGRVTFVGQDSIAGDFGLFQHDSNVVNPEIRIFHEGDTIGGRTSSLQTGSVPVYGVNSSGSVVFGAFDTSGPDQLLARWDSGDSEPAILLDQTSPQSGFNDVFFPPTKKLTAGGAAVFSATEGGSGYRLYGLDDVAPAAQVRVNDQISVSGMDYQPGNVLGATGLAGSGATLFQAIKDPSGSPTLAVILKKSDSNLIELGSFDGSGTLQMAAEMSASGNVAAYIPSGSGGSLVYMIDSPAASSPTTIAAVGDTISGEYTITRLALAGGSAPMVNDLGVVVFDAEIEDSLGEKYAALLAWSEGSAGPTVILKSGDALEINGNMVSVAAFSDAPIPFTPNTPFPGLSSEADPLKDGLNDANQLAFGILYDSGGSLRQGLVMTQVPEPSGITVLTVALCGLLSRRKRP